MSLIITVITLDTAVLYAQDSNNNDSLKQIVVDYSELAQFLNRNNKEFQILTGSVELRQDSNYMYCDRAVLNQSNDLSANGKVLIQQTDSVFLYSDSLFYSGNQLKAELFGNVSLVNNAYKLFTEELYYDMDSRVAKYSKGALLSDGETQLISKRGNYFVNEKLAIFKDSVLIIDSNFILKTDSLDFYTDRKWAVFKGPTVILQDSARIYCEGGYYDIASGLALFTDNAYYIKGDQYARADSMWYNQSSRSIRLDGNAVFEDGNRNAQADVITYFENKGTAILRGDAFVNDSLRTIRADSINYDTRSEHFYSSGRSKIWNESQYLEADEMDMGDPSTWGFAQGKVIWVDTIENMSLYSERVLFRRKDKEVKAIRVDSIRPYVINVIDGDSLWISADTLYSYVSRDSSIHQDSSRNLDAYHRVRAFKSNLQFICDSLSYDDQDSIFYFYDHPIMWSDTSQFIADTISLQMADNNIDYIRLDNNAIIINSKDEIFYNQIKGRNIKALFNEGQLSRMHVVGNAESLYFATDDEDAYIGVNKTICAKMLVYFGHNEVEGIKFYQSPESVMTPMQQASDSELKLEGFKWNKDIRPKSKYDIIGSSINLQIMSSQSLMKNNSDVLNNVEK